LLLIIVYSVEGVKRSKAGCIVCGKKSQKASFRIVRTSDSDVENCFGVKISSCESTVDICEGCRRALQTYKRTGQTFHHVSVHSNLFPLTELC